MRALKTGSRSSGGRYRETTRLREPSGEPTIAATRALIDAGADGVIPEEKVADPGPSESAPEGRVPPLLVCTRKVPPRAFQIRKNDAETHGYTRGCPGCTSWFRGLGRQAHTPECRDRFAKLLKDDVRFQRAESKRVEFEEKATRRDEKRRKRAEEAEVGAQVEVPVPVGGGPVDPGASGSVPDMAMSEAAIT